MAVQLTQEDQAWINTGSSDQIKEVRKNALINFIEMNGIKYDPGLGKSYIPVKNYYRQVRIPDMPQIASMNLENALNFEALGGGIGGLAGSAVRAGLQKFFHVERETVVISVYEAGYDLLIQNFLEYTASRKDVYAFWLAQAQNVLGLAGAIFNREMHHWNAENTKPQQALLGSLGQLESIPESEYRKLFYLAIHPIPLDHMELVRARIARDEVTGINDVVTIRCKSAPAGYGDIHATAQAVSDLKTEQYFAAFGNSIKSDLDKLEAANAEVTKDAAKYHLFAANFGEKRKIFDKNLVKRAMICTTAYIVVNIKGSLAQSAALRKFRNANARLVQKWIVAFEAANQVGAQSVADLAKD